MQAILQVCAQIGGVCGIILSALSSRISQQETMLPGVMSDVGIVGVVVTVLSIALVGSIAAAEARREQSLRRVREAELLTALAELRHRLEASIPAVGKNFDGADDRVQIEDRLARLTSEMSELRRGNFIESFARKFVSVNL